MADETVLVCLRNSINEAINTHSACLLQRFLWFRSGKLLALLFNTVGFAL